MLVGVVVVLKVVLGVLEISKKNGRSSGRMGAPIAVYITISKSLKGRRGL